MQTLKNRVLIISKNIPPQLLIEADHITSVENLTTKPDANYDVICGEVDCFVTDGVSETIQKLRKKNLGLQLVAVMDNTNQTSSAQQALQKLTFFRILTSWNTKQLEPALIMALEMAQKNRQDEDLAKLVQEQNIKLKQLYTELEDRVEKRQRYLLEAKTKTFVAQTRWESMRHALMAIHRAQSVTEIEHNLYEALSPTMNLDVVRIIFKPQNEIFSQQTGAASTLTVFQAPLFKGQESLGSIFYIRNHDLPFYKDETDFFLRISEAVGLAVDRLQKLEQSLLFKEQWETTFNSVTDPLALINKNYEVIQSNLAFAKKAHKNQEQVKGQKCYKLLFDRESPCPNCKIGQNFRLEGRSFKNSTLEVYSQGIRFSEEEHVFVNLYHDITEQVRMEKRLLENSKLAELGTIGSSIAHELNNPLGGILSFVQLIKMDLEPTNPIYLDIQEMENGVRRCQEIVQNLLGFTRQAGTEDFQNVDLREILEKTLKIVDLQTKSRGISVKIHTPSRPLFVQAISNLLTQALKNILQNSIDSLVEKVLSQRGFQAQIDVHLIDNEQDAYEIHILDNGLGLDHRTNINMSVAQQILHDHKATLEFSTQSKQLAMAKISFPRPVLQQKSAN